MGAYGALTLKQTTLLVCKKNVFQHILDTLIYPIHSKVVGNTPKLVQPLPSSQRKTLYGSLGKDLGGMDGIHG